MHCNFMIYAFSVASATSRRSISKGTAKIKKMLWEKLRLLWVNCSVMPILRDKSAYWLLIPDHKMLVRTIPFVYDILKSHISPRVSRTRLERRLPHHKSYHLSFKLIIYFWWKQFDAAKPSRQIALANDVFRSSIHDKSMMMQTKRFCNVLSSLITFQCVFFCPRNRSLKSLQSFTSL